MPLYCWLDYESRIWFGYVLSNLNVFSVTSQPLELSQFRGYISVLKTDKGEMKKITLVLDDGQNTKTALHLLHPSLSFKQLVQLSTKVLNTFADNVEFAQPSLGSTGLYLNELYAEQALNFLSYCQCQIPERKFLRKVHNVYPVFSAQATSPPPNPYL